MARNIVVWVLQHMADTCIKRDDPEQVAQEIVNLVKDRLPKAYQQPLSNIQVLTPMQRSVVGAGNLNMMLQQSLNTSTLGISRGGGSIIRDKKPHSEQT